MKLCKKCGTEKSLENFHDHARPIASFNFNSPDDKEFKDCWALSNLRPLEAKENMSKGSRIAA